MSMWSLCLEIEWAPALRAGAHAIVKHDEEIDIAVTYPFSRNDFPGAERALKSQASLPNSQIARPYRPKG